MSEDGDGFDKTEDAGTGQAARPSLAPGSHLGKYRLDRVLGEGGMGVVWAAHDPDLERSVAIKLLRYEQASAQLRQRLLREARAMAKLKHPNVLTVYEVGTTLDRDYIAMELVEGQSLDTWFGHATLDERWDAIIAAGRGLAAAHAAGVVHRDFKPHNVLRSRDGRVLVTDFGLARGLVGDVEASGAGDKALLDPAISPFDATLQPPARISSSSGAGIDTPLTQTGALIGTPAYMAPEQYRGAPPDPRTDQFAFCVTVWQALTGERPFKGQTLDEMRQSASAGVAHIPAKLPGAVRAVLARGLDPDAAKRWPSLEDLLDALERAHDLPIRRRRIAFAVFGLAAAVLLFITMRPSAPGRAFSDCDHPEKLFADAWTPAKMPSRVATAFDQFGKRWVDSYTQACRFAVPKVKAARIACLESARDDVSALALAIGNAPPQQIEQFDAPGMLPNLKSCESAAPLTPLLVPRKEPARGKAIEVLAKLTSLRQVPDDQLDAEMTRLESEARTAAGDMFGSSVGVTFGNEYLRRGDLEKARKAFSSFLRLPPPRNQRFEAIARVGLLEASLNELVEPHARLPADLEDPHARLQLHPELATLLMAARSAAGSDDVLLGAVALLESQVFTRAAQWNRYKSAYDDALQAAEKGRKHFDAINDVRRSAGALAEQANIYLQRGDDRALDDAAFAARQASDALEREQLAPRPILDEIRAQVAFMRRDFTEAHRRFDKLGAPEPVTAPTITGHVTGAAAGHTVTVVAWQGDLTGDRARLYTDPRTVHGEIVQAADDGAFTIHAQPGWAIIAEAKGMRSKPVLVTAAPPVLSLVATTTISGTAAGRNLFGVRAFARFTAGTSRFIVEAPIDRDETFDLAGLPPGTPQLGTTGDAGDGTRTLLAGEPSKLEWTHGQALDVIVRGAPEADVVVVRGNAPAHSAAELEGMVAATIDTARCEVHPVGADNTDAGRDVYAHGDRHCVITGNLDDTYTVFAVAGDRFARTTVTLKTTVSVDYADGRFAGGTTPVVVTLP